MCPLYMCVYTYMCMYTQTHSNTHIYRIHKRGYTYMHIHACMRARLHTCTHMHTYTHTYVVCLWIIVSLYTCVYTHVPTQCCVSWNSTWLEPFWLPTSTSLVLFPLSFLQSHIAKRRVQQAGCSERRIYGVFALTHWESHLRHPGLSPWLWLQNNFWYLIGQNLGYSWPLYLRQEFKGKACQVPWEIPKEFWLELHGICWFSGPNLSTRTSVFWPLSA